MNKILLFLSLILFFNADAQVSSDAGPDRMICLFDTLKVTGSGLNPGDTGSYQWTDLNTNTVISNKNNFITKITSLTIRTYELKVTRISNKVTYTAYDTFVLTVSPLPTFKYKGPASLCLSEVCLNLTYNIIATAMQGNDTSKKFYDLRYFQRYKTQSWISGGPVGKSPFVYCPGNYITNGQVPQTGLRDTICYDYKDKNGCYNYECKPIRLNPNPDVRTVDGIYCQRAGLVTLDKLVTIPFNRSGGVETWRCIGVPAGSGVNPGTIITVDNSSTPAKHYLDIGLEGENNKTGDYLVEYCYKNAITGCQRCDTSKVTAVRLPEIVFDTIPGQCTNGPLLDLDSFIRDKFTGKRITGSWQCVAFMGSRNTTISDVNNAINNSVKSQKFLDPRTIKNGGLYFLKVVVTTGGCPVSDSIEVKVNGLPVIMLNGPDSLCSGSGNHQLISNYPSSDPNGLWTGEFVSNGMLNTNAVSMGSSYSKTTKAKFTYQHPLTKCYNSDSQNVTIIKRPTFKFVQSVIKNSQYLVNFDLIDSNMNIRPFKWYWDYGNGATSSDKYPREVLYMDSGNFKVFLTIDNGVCSTRDSITFVLNYKASGVKDISNGRLLVYPNPVTGILNIESESSGKIRIIDMKGQVIYSGGAVKGVQQQVDMGPFASGVYILAFDGPGRSYRVKLIRQ